MATEREKEILEMIERAKEIRVAVGSGSPVFFRITKAAARAQVLGMAAMGLRVEFAWSGVLHIEAPQ